MKTMKKTLALLMAVVMCMSLMSMAAFADETSAHTITITNTDQNVSHTYEGYQIFKGKLDTATNKLSDIQWGEGVNGDTLRDALKASNDDSLLTGEVGAKTNVFKDCTSAADVAKVIGELKDNAAAVDAIAKIIGEGDNVLNTSKKFSLAESDAGKTYTANVTGDGYYFIKDTTSALSSEDGTGSDTLSKYLLEVVKNVTVEAKDTGIKPEKKIVQGSERVKTGTAAVGDIVTFEVKIKVPDTRKYVDHFIFDMKDKLPEGMTFMGVSSVKVGNSDVTYTLTVAPKDSTEYATYTPPADAAAAVTTAGGQNIKLVFNNFKASAEAGNWIGEDMVITYTAVVNDDANFTPTGNLNEVVFDYSNDPNHDYDGDQPGPGDNDVMGVTPKDQTKTLLTNIEITKTGDGGTVPALAGAEFEITSSDYNVTLVTGEKYVTSDYTAQTGETVQDGTWYKLKDGTYTSTAPGDDTSSSYQSTTETYKLVTFQKVNTTPGETNKVTVMSGADGKITLEGLKPGTYTIRETKAPAGYNNDNTTYTIKLKFDEDTKAIVLDTTSSEGVTFDGTTATAKLTIDNKGGAELPSTGGIGTKIFYTMGAVLVIGAGVVLVSRKRAGE